LPHSRIENALLTDLTTQINNHIVNGKFQPRTKDSQIEEITSVYFGGGTPSLARPELIEKILSSIKHLTASELEITLEANPTSVEILKLNDFKNAGINRLSLGIQSLNDRDLKFFNRQHSVAQAMNAIQVAKEIFDNISMDFIWGRPDQTLDNWKSELNHIVLLNSPNLSIYQLTVERGTPLYISVQNAEIFLPNEDVLADMFDYTRIFLTEKGYQNYETSSFSKSVGYRSKHNQAYWDGSGYLGIGPGAHGKLDGLNNKSRTFAILEPKSWMDQCENIGNGIRRIEAMSWKEAGDELLVSGLRTLDGVTNDRLLEVTRGHHNLNDLLDLDKVRMLQCNGFINCNWMDGSLKTISSSEKGHAVVDSICRNIIV
jgi:putative oxygen-independent coproporphyrinogen III oxidase